MTRLIATTIGFAAGGFVFGGDPLIGFLLALCAMVFVAITSRQAQRLPSIGKSALAARPE